MRIAWFSEMGFSGQISKDYNNLKSDVALISCSGATHIPYNFPIKTEEFSNFDFVMVNCTRKFFTEPQLINRIDEIKKHCKIGFFQEGPIYDWQDWEPREKDLWRSVMKKIDIYFCSNQRDIPYYMEYVNDGVPVKWLKSPINIEKINKHITDYKHRHGVLVGGTGCIWYNGDTSIDIADSINSVIFIPAMGRLKNTEPIYFSRLKNKTYILPYSDFDGWIENISNLKYAVHMMPTYAAGSFHTNMASLGIPCIGSEEIDTQRILFPELSLHTYRDIKKGKQLLKRLKEDKEFYHKVSKYAKEKVREWDLDIVANELKKDISDIL